MGKYVNPGTGKFKISTKSKIYFDKSGLISKTNEAFGTRERFICISRPRRFGKTMAAEMLAAYYGRGKDATPLFDKLNVSNCESYREHLNQYDCIMINIQKLLSRSKTVEEMIATLSVKIIKDLRQIYPTLNFNDSDHLVDVMEDIYEETNKPFVILLDEWDCLFRVYKNDLQSQRDYLDFLQLWLKDQEYVGLAYMTGILPIKKYGTHSALNMFEEYSMTSPSSYQEYFGFTGAEVEQLTKAYEMNFEEVKDWYNGYFVESEMPIYNPMAVSKAIRNRNIENYWNSTETYEALQAYIQLNFDGLRDKVIQLIANVEVSINPDKFANDMSTFKSSDDVLTLLVHLGYLSYSPITNKVRVPNQEVRREFINAIEDLDDFDEIVRMIKQSEDLLEYIWRQEEEVVANAIQEIHEKNVSILEYNNENALSCTMTLALYAARNYYSIIRELPTGKGFADLVFIPKKKHQDKPAMIIELKWDKQANGAINQIKDKNYISALEEYQGDLLLVGINYDKQTKKHECLIESYCK